MTSPSGPFKRVGRSLVGRLAASSPAQCVDRRLSRAIETRTPKTDQLAQTLATLAAYMHECFGRFDAKLADREAPGPAVADGNDIEFVTEAGVTHPVRTVELFGHRYTLAGVDGDDLYLSQVGEFDNETRFDWVCSHLLPAEGVLIDVGANIGVTTMIAAGRVPGASVYAIEAGPHVYRRLAENIASNLGPTVRAYHCAVGAEAGEITFTERSAYGHVSVDSYPNDGGRHVSVAMRTLDEFVSTEQVPHVDLVKIDVEGFEKHVLDGYTAAEGRDDPLFFVEFNAWTLLAFGRLNPLVFLEYVIDRFAEVRFFDGEQLSCLDHTSKHNFLHRNLIEHGCVDDILFTNDASRLVPDLPE